MDSGTLNLILALQTLALVVIAGVLAFVAVKLSRLWARVAGLIDELSQVVSRVDRLVAELEERGVARQSAELVSSLNQVGAKLTEVAETVAGLVGLLRSLSGELPRTALRRGFRVMQVAQAIGEGIAAGLSELRSAQNEQEGESGPNRE